MADDVLRKGGICDPYDAQPPRRARMTKSPSFRARTLSKPILSWYRTVLPPISPTERDAIAAGTVWWDADLFSGKPEWKKLRDFVKPALSAEEQLFLDGPVEKLC